MRIESGTEPDEILVSGCAAGETIELPICNVANDFNPKTDASLRCGSDLNATITPDDESFTATYSPPDQIDLADGTTVRCADGGCALVAYDAGWPDKVFAVYRGA